MSILIVKAAETPESVDYTFESDVYDRDPRFRDRMRIIGQSNGILRLLKNTGEITLLKPMDLDIENKCFERAAEKVRRHWEANELPDRTQWASG
jgi:hypothetical protein